MPSTIQSTYAAIRSQIEVGDSLAFVGRNGLFSWLIRTFTGRPTHVAAVQWVDDDGGTPRVVLVEAIEGIGVVSSYASTRIEAYDGQVYLMKLDKNIAVHRRGISDWLQGMIGQPYSMVNAILSAPSQWLRIPGRRRANSLFCSKLDWLSKSEGGRMNQAYLGRDASPTPNQLKRLPIWEKFIQIKGEPEAL